MKRLAIVFLCVIAAAIGFSAEVSNLVHRWSFNGDLTDSVGGQTAKVVGSATSNGKQYTLPGGGYGSSYIDLGSDVLPKTSKAVTIEIWAKQISAQNYSRIFSFGGSNGNLYMEWTLGSYLNYDEVWFGGKNFPGYQSRLAPYSLGTEYHISVVMAEGEGGVWMAKYYKKSNSTGETLATYAVQGSNSWSLKNQDLSKCYLGQEVNGSSENTANASYNEVRIWNRALTEDELTASAKAGPDVLPDWIRKPSCTITFDANGGSSTPAAITRDEGSEYGELPTVTRSGYTFDGWYTAVTGGTKITATTKVTGNVTLYAHWIGTGLVHRWSFNGDLADSVGGQTATAVGSAVSVGTTQCALTGSSNGAGYISLGSNILPSDGSPVTMELWVTYNASRSYSRIWSIDTVVNSKCSDELCMGWTSGAGYLIIRGANNKYDDSALGDYSTGTEYHLGVVFEPVSGGAWNVTAYKQDANGRTLSKVTLSTSKTSWSLTTQSQDYCCLGHVHGGSEFDANASYNEVRVWSRALTEDELSTSAKTGPDVLPGKSSFVIKFDANGGTPTPSDIIRDADAEYGALPTVTRTGYTFDGWYTAASGGTKATATTKATENATLYAHWAVVEYAITYNLDGGTNASSNPATYTIEDAVALAAPTRSGYTFSGWTPNGGKIAKGSTGAKTFTAMWTRNEILEVNNDGDREYSVGEDVSWDCNLFVVEASSSVTVSVTGLPDGLGYRTEVDDNEVLVYFTGRAVRAGRYQVLCNATDANGRTASDSIWIEIVEAEDSVFSYVENGDGTITLMQYTGAVIPEELVIPTEYDGKRVTGVGSLSSDNDGVSFFGANIDEGIIIGNVLKSVVLPEGLETVGINSPFAYQSGITSVEFPSTLKNIGDWAFCCCTGLKSADLSGTALENCLWSSFAGCTSLTDVKFPSTLTTLGGISFAWCRALKIVAFAGDAPTIQDSASDGGDRKKWGDWADRIYVDSDFDFQDAATQGANPRYLTEITTYVRPGSTGWGTVPGTWQGCAIVMDESGLDAGNVRFDANGGTCSTASKAILVGSFYGDLPAAVRNGYSFAGWFSSATGGRMITSASIVPSEATLYAHWIPLPDDLEAQSRLYMVIDLSGGTSASVYPISYLSAVPANGWTDEYKTTKLVMRRIESQEFGGHSLDNPYFIGVFETTQRQWELVMGNRPSGFSKSSCYAMRPVDSTVYQMLRGGQEGLKWPMSADVDDSSFIGVLRRKTGLDYLDLPTEAQWECACRAGTTSDYNNGRNSGLDELGRYRSNGGGTICGSELDATAGTAIVGSYTPNEWGLFDMHGNVSEVCLDYEFGYPADLDLYRDRVAMGGCWSDPASYCRASSKGYMLFSGVFAGTGSPGNRLACTMGAHHVGILRYVQFDENGGSSLYKNGWFVEGTRFDVLPEAERSGYAFLGWFTAAEGGSQVSSFEVGDADVHLYAHWRAIYTITFNSNGGAPTPAPITRMDGEALGALPSVTKNGYDLDGWYTAASGGTKVAATTKVTEGMALYAHWTAVAYSITYNLGGGDNVSSNPATYTIEDEVTLAAPTRSGYTFTGWAPDGGVIAKGSVGARTFTANWVLASNTYLIEFDAMGGSPAPSSICRAWGATYGDLPTVSYNGYSFDGWYTAPNGGVKVSKDTKADSYAMLYAHWIRKSGTAEVDLIYADNGDGTLTIQGVKGSSTQTPSLVIPPEKDGRKITCIGDKAFSGRGVESVTFPSTLMKIGNYAFENNRGLKSLTIPDGVMNIGGRAFELCESLSALSIPASVESIGDYAFYCCHGLRRLTVSARLSEVGIMVFGNCEKLESVELCEGMENVGWGMFSQCDSLTAVVIPSSVTNIGKMAFKYCDKLSKVELREGVLKISDSAFMRCEALPAIVIPSSVMEVGAHAFDNCVNLESAVFCEGVRCIGASAFSGCSGLQSVDIPSTVEQMGSAIFAKCKALKSVLLGQGLPLIGPEMFRECEGLVSICIPSGVVQVADSAFASCIRLETVTGCDGVRNIADKAFSGCGNLLSFNLPSTLTNIGDEAFMDCRRLTSVVVPGSVKRIGEDAYSGCDGMMSLEIRNGVEYIGDGAFSHCVGLTSLTIPSSVKHIDTYSFWGCSSIRTVVIHAGLKSMGSYPFGYCTNLTEVAFPRSVATLGTATFLGCDKIPKKIYVESGDSERVKRLFANSSTDVSCMTFVETTSEPEHVVFNANGGISSINAEILLYGAEYGMLPAASRMGYAFDGWYSAASGGAKVSEATKVTGDAMLYAHWLAEDYAIAYNLEGGVNSASNPSTYTIEDEVVLAAPTRSGYTFSGWTPNDGKIAKGSTGAKTFTATWMKNVVVKYTISFNANGGSSAPAAITREEGAEYGELPTLTRTGYTFDGWYTAASGGTKVTATTKATGDVTLYAHWIEAALSAIAVSGVEVFSGYPWQEVVIGYTITGSSEQPVALEVSAKDNATGKTYACKTLDGVSVAPGSHVIKWNASADGAKFESDDVIFTMRFVTPPSQYCVIDLSGGSSAKSYPVTYLVDKPKDGWPDDYKKTKLVLRRIEAGSFKMQNQYDVTITRPFYIGVFEVTQNQWELVMGEGTNPSGYFGWMRPVEKVNYDMIRGSDNGSKWPNSDEVDSDSFAGRLRLRTGLNIDLPTEAQWEYACRAGTTSDYNNGKSSPSCLAAIGRYYWNRSDGKGGCGDAHTVVGLYEPNAWGLYDMHGNVWEWCLDWYGGLKNSTDPKGPENIVWYNRTMRGGAWNNLEDHCTSSYRLEVFHSTQEDYYGFRLARTVLNEDTIIDDGGRVVVAEALSDRMSVDTTFEGLISAGSIISVAYGSVGAKGCTITANGEVLIESEGRGTLQWTPSGASELIWRSGSLTMMTAVKVNDSIPELPSSASADEVRAALEGSADAKLQENITDATVYGQYREWAMKIGAESVKGAANSWISFAVDSASLLEKVPVDSDLKIEEFKPALAEGVFDFTVSVKDVTVGSGATDANLKKVFGLGGTTQLGTGEFDPDKVALEFGTPVNGKLKFTASPKDKTAKSFFMKMKVR